MRDLLTRIVDSDPFYDDPDEGPACTFCWSKKRSTHAPGCEWVEARELLARIKGE